MTRKSYHASRRSVRENRFMRFYVLGAIIVLGATSLVWSIIGATIQMSNADQSANTLLLEDQPTIAGALLPSQHTFLLKTPLFWLISLFGSEPAVFIAATVALSLITVAGLAYILWRIDKRPLTFGTTLLLLSVVLLYIPAQSYPGSLLPANFAMLTTRNIEYVLFVGAVILVLRAQRFKSFKLLLSALALGLLFVSDKLFITLAIGTAAITGLVFVVARRRDLIILSARLLAAVIIAYMGAIIALALLTTAGLHFDNGSPLGPYGFVQSPKDLLVALVFAFTGLLGNFGANPAFATVITADVPLAFIRGIFSPAGIGYVVTLSIVCLAIMSSLRVLKALFKKRRAQKPHVIDWQSSLPVFLMATTASALFVYVVSNHYYPVDSRYLAIALFSGFTSIAAAYRTLHPKRSRVLTVAVICVTGTLFGTLFQFYNLAAQNRALGIISTRNTTVATALKSHPTATLLGNYWRVIPIKLSTPAQTVTPLEACATPRQVLSSSAWQPDLNKTSFAYILRLDGGLAGFPTCTLKDITAKYGRPDSSVVIDGTRADPKEILLFYDDSIHILPASAPSKLTTDTVKPISLSTMPFTTCPSKTVMQFVAHEDDDILFMNPDLIHDIKAKHCIRTVFFTAGDAGGDKLYWLGRQKGAEEAYNTILGTPGAPWTERIVSVDGNHTITVANPRGNHAISLIFLHLPDGNPDGTGFASKNFESLAKLAAGTISTVHPVDDSHESYSGDELTTTLINLMKAYKPTEVRSQSTFGGTTIRDHSDHNAVGAFATRAFGVYRDENPDATETFYLGYPIHTLPPNVSGTDYDEKVAAFLTFSRFDGATCHTLVECNTKAVYGNYLQRQYTYPY